MGCEIFICTATDYRNVKPKYEQVIAKYFPFIDWKHMIVAYNKQMIQADFIIDDYPQNLYGGCQGFKLLMAMPHNQGAELESDMICVNDWKSAELFILRQIYDKGFSFR